MVDAAPSALRAIGIAALGVVSAAILGADVTADFPRGDGGLFHAICQQIIAAHFIHPAHILYNRSALPFSYSPAAFYAVAALSIIAHQTVAHTMNLWVILWDFLIAPAAYISAKQFLKSKLSAFIATAFLVVITANSAYLGMGGAITRAPAFVFYLLACGATWKALRHDNQRTLWTAALLCSTIAWIHMEFFFLYAVSACLFAVWLRPPIARVARLGGIAAIFSIPWLCLVPDLRTLLNAIGTAHFGSNTLPLGVLASYFGIDVFRVGFFPAFVPLFILACGVVGLLTRRPLWIVWALVILTADSRAGTQAAHLPSALSIGWCFDIIREKLEARQFSFPASSLLTGGLTAALALAACAVYYDAQSFPRLSAANAADAAWMQNTIPANASVVVLSPARFRDMTYEWFSALSDRTDPLTYEGLEWVDSRAFADRIHSFEEFNQKCRNAQGWCIVHYAHKLRWSAPTYMYVPQHGDRSRYEMLVANLSHDRRFKRILNMRGGQLFLLADAR